MISDPRPPTLAPEFETGSAIVSQASPVTVSTRRPLVSALPIGVAAAPLAFSLVWLPFKFGGLSPGWLDAAELSTFAAVAALVAAGALPTRFSPEVRRILWAMAGLAVAAAVATAFSRQISVSVPLLVEWLWLGAEALLVAFVARQRRGRELLGGLLLVAVFAQVFWSSYAWWGSQNPAHQQVGTFYAANQYAGYVLLLAPLCLAVCLLSSSWITAGGAAVASAFLYLGIVLSGSRAGIH